MLTALVAGLVPPRDAASMSMTPAPQKATGPPDGWVRVKSNTTTPPRTREGVAEQLSVQAHAARETAASTKLQHSTLRCQVVEKTVALIEKTIKDAARRIRRSEEGRGVPGHPQFRHGDPASFPFRNS